MSRRKNQSQKDASVPSPVHASHGAAAHERFRPWLLAALVALCVVRPLFPSESAAQFGDGLTVVMLWLVLAVFWILSQLGRPTLSLRFGWTDAAVLLLLGWHTIAALCATAHASPRPAVNMLWEWIGMGVCFFLARQLVVTPRETRAVAAVMVALAVALAGYGLYQYGWEMPQTRAAYHADPDLAMRNAGMWFPTDSPERKLFEDRLASREPMATFALTNSLAGYLVPWLIVAIGVMWSLGQRRRQWFGAAAVAAVPAVCLLLTQSRSGYVATGVGVVLAWALCRGQVYRIGWRVPMMIGVSVAVLIAGAVAVGGIDRELFSQASKSFGYRIQYWQSSARLIADHPLFGCGPGNFQNAYSRYKVPEASEEVADPHNFLLEIWATAGTPAAVAFLAVLGCFAFATVRGNSDAAAEALCLPGVAKGPPLPCPATCDAWPHVLIGGVGGFLLSVPVGLLVMAPPSGVAVLLGLPLAAGTIAVLVGWIRDGQMPRLLAGVAIVGLLVNLLAAGGIGFPAVAGTFWLLMALGLHGQPVRHFSANNAWLLLTVAVLMTLTCYATAYRPVLGCQAEMRLAERDPAHAIEHLEAAAEADRLAVEPWRHLAAIRFEQWHQTPADEAFQRFERANAEVFRLTPNAAPARLVAGDWYSRAFAKTDRTGNRVASEAIQKAIVAYLEAIERYPHNAAYHAKLAEAFEAARDHAGFLREAKLALELDGITPHLDKKLPADLRQRLERSLSGNGEGGVIRNGSVE